MKKLKLLPLVLILLLALSLLPVSALAVTEPNISALAAVLADADSGEIYYEKNADRTAQPASTTKIMTALLVVEAIERGEIALSDTVTASGNVNYNLEEDSTDAMPRLVSGETMSVEDLLYCVMLVSANEACNALAEYVSGSVSDFVEAMNARAEELGCTNTHFANANGLEEDGHYSTAGDFAVIAREAMSHRLFSTICGTLNHTVPATNVAESRSLVNTNALIDPASEYYFEPAYGIKTGFFTNAGYCLVSAAQKDGINVICVLFGGQGMDSQFSDSLTLYNWLFDNFESRQILSPTETILTAPVELGAADSVGVRAENGVNVVLPRDFDLTRIGYEYVLYHEQNGEGLRAPVNIGQVLGELTVVELDENRQAVQSFGTSRLVAASTVEMSRREYLQTQLLELIEQPVIHKIVLALVIILSLYVLLVLIYSFQRVRHLHSLRKAKRARARRQAAEDAQWLSIPDEEDRVPDVDFFPEQGSPAPQLEEVVRKTVEEEPEPPAPVETRVTPIRSASPEPSTPAPVRTAVDPIWSAAPEPAPAKKEPEPPAVYRPKNPEELHKEVFDDDFFNSFFDL